MGMSKTIRDEELSYAIRFLFIKAIDWAFLKVDGFLQQRQKVQCSGFLWFDGLE